MSKGFMGRGMRNQTMPGPRKSSDDAISCALEIGPLKTSAARGEGSSDIARRLKAPAHSSFFGVALFPTIAVFPQTSHNLLRVSLSTSLRVALHHT